MFEILVLQSEPRSINQTSTNEGTQEIQHKGRLVCYWLWGEAGQSQEGGMKELSNKPKFGLEYLMQ